MVITGNDVHVKILQYNVDRGLNGNYSDLVGKIPSNEMNINGTEKILLRDDTKYVYFGIEPNNYSAPESSVEVSMMKNGHVLSSAESEPDYFYYNGIYVVGEEYFIIN